MCAPNSMKSVGRAPPGLVDDLVACFFNSSRDGGIGESFTGDSDRAVFEIYLHALGARYSRNFLSHRIAAVRTSHARNFVDFGAHSEKSSSLKQEN